MFPTTTEPPGHNLEKRPATKENRVNRGRPEVFSRQAAYVPQENPLMEELSVRDNLLLWHRGSRKELERDLAEGPAAMLGVSSMLRQRAGHLSGGMKKRLARKFGSEYDDYADEELYE